MHHPLLDVFVFLLGVDMMRNLHTNLFSSCRIHAYSAKVKVLVTTLAEINTRANEVACVSEETSDREHYHMNIGITPYRGSGSTSGPDYFKTSRYKGFENYLRRACTRFGITIEQIEHLQGVWEGKIEPATSVWITGERERIITLADDLGARYNQSAVLLFEPDDEAEGFIYQVVPGADESRDAIITSLSKHRISGGRLVASGNIEIADPDGSLAGKVIALAQSLNGVLTYSRGHVILREQNVHYGGNIQKDE